MAEGKKRLYKRETVRKSLQSFTDQLRKVVQGETDFPDEVLHAVVFGSYVNSDSPMLHDLDIGIVVREHREAWPEYINRHRDAMTGDWLVDLYLPQVMLGKFLRQRNYIISLHYCTEKQFLMREHIQNVLFSDAHVFLVKDLKLCEGSIAQLGLT